MAEYLAFQPHVKFSLYRNRVTKLCYASQDIHTKTMRCYYPGCRKVTQLSSWKVRVPRGIGLAKPNASHHHQKSPVKCFCFGSLINTDGVASGWIPVVDKVLLMTSIFLTYTAGVIPVDRSIRVSPENILKDSSAPADPTFSGSAMDHDHEVNSKLTWDAVKDKIGDSLNAIEGGFNLGNKATELEQDHTKRLSNICAVAEGPMFRLLWASFQRLKEEVDNITGSSLTLEMDDMQIILSDIIQRSLPSVCIDWLRAEVCLTNRKSAKELPTTIVERLNGYESISQNIVKSGKEGLYSELICFLRFGSLRQGCYYDYSFFTRHGISILEDLVITLADGIAGLYLELISIDSDISNEINSLGLSLCTLSTRALQRLRNEVALKQWLYQNMDAVVSMYEDRFDLCTLQSLLIEEPSKSDTEKFSWLKKLSLRKSGPASSSFRVAVLSYICVPVKRTKELRVLGGWRYYFSLYLELADITMPLIRTLVSKVSDAISFFLVCLIGRSLGLIYTGIRQSLRWK